MLSRETARWDDTTSVISSKADERLSAQMELCESDGNTSADITLVKVEDWERDFGSWYTDRGPLGRKVPELTSTVGNSKDEIIAVSFFSKSSDDVDTMSSDLKPRRVEVIEAIRALAVSPIAAEQPVSGRTAGPSSTTHVLNNAFRSTAFTTKHKSKDAAGMVAVEL